MLLPGRRIRRPVRSRAESFDIFGLYGCYTDISLKVLGGYQRANAASRRGGRRAVHGRRAGGRHGPDRARSTGGPRASGDHQHPASVHLRRFAQSPGMEETMRSLEQILERRRLIAVDLRSRDKEA